MDTDASTFVHSSSASLYSSSGSLDGKNYSHCRQLTIPSDYLIEFQLPPQAEDVSHHTSSGSSSMHGDTFTPIDSPPRSPRALTGKLSTTPPSARNTDGPKLYAAPPLFPSSLHLEPAYSDTRQIGLAWLYILAGRQVIDHRGFELSADILENDVDPLCVLTPRQRREMLWIKAQQTDQWYFIQSVWRSYAALLYSDVDRLGNEWPFDDTAIAPHVWDTEEDSAASSDSGYETKAEFPSSVNVRLRVMWILHLIGSMENRTLRRKWSQHLDEDSTGRAEYPLVDVAGYSSVEDMAIYPPVEQWRSSSAPPYVTDLYRRRERLPLQEAEYNC